MAQVVIKYKYFLLVCAIVWSVAFALSFVYEAHASETLSIAITGGSTNYLLLSNTPAVGQIFIASSTSFRSVEIDPWSGHWYTASTSMAGYLSLCKGQPPSVISSASYLSFCADNNLIARELVLPESGPTNDILRFNQSYPTIVGDYYYWVFYGYDISGEYSNAKIGYNTANPYSYGKRILASTTASMFVDGGEPLSDTPSNIYEDEAQLNSPESTWQPSWAGWPAMDSNVKYHFNSKPNCVIGSACNIAYFWDENGLCYADKPCGPEAIGDEISMYYYNLNGNGRMEGLVIGSSTVAYSTGTTSHNVVAVIANYDVRELQYCAVIEDPHHIYRNQTICGITANWVTQHTLDLLYAKEACEGNAASSTICNEDDSGASWFDFSCGLKKFANWAFTPSESVCENWFNLMADLDDQFPISVYRKVQDDLDLINKASSTASSTLVLPLYWAGQKLNVNILDAEAIRNSDAGDLYMYVYKLVEYLMYILLFFAFVFRVINIGDIGRSANTSETTTYKQDGSKTFTKKSGRSTSWRF